MAVDVVGARAPAVSASPCSTSTSRKDGGSAPSSPSPARSSRRPCSTTSLPRRPSTVTVDPGTGGDRPARDAHRRQPGRCRRSQRRALLVVGRHVRWRPIPSASVRYRSLPRPETAPPGAASAPVGVPAELYRCPDSSVIDDIAGVLAQGTTEPLERLSRIEAWLKLTKIYDPEAPGGQTVRSVERFLSPGLRPRQPRGLRDLLRAARPLRRRAGARRRRIPGPGRRRPARVHGGRRRGLGRDPDRRCRVGAARPRPDPRGAATSGGAGQPAAAGTGRAPGAGAGADDRSSPPASTTGAPC